MFGKTWSPPKYMRIRKLPFIPTEEEVDHVRVARNTKEACELVEAGFEYVTGEYDDGGKIFRKRK